MKFETLKKNNIWKWIGVTLIICIICILVTFTVTRANYRIISKMEIVNGTIHYKSGDVSVLAVNIQNTDGTYTESEDFPTSGYSLNTDESYCVRSVDGELVTQDVTLSYENNSLLISNITKKGTKCFLYFDKYVPNGTFAEILSSNYYTIDDSRSSGSFTSTFEEDTAGTIFSGTDDYGTTYFFAGANPNNWVKFAELYWRIIRINGDGSIRLIYNGTDTSATGTTTQINTSVFNSSYDDNAYVGYMYGTAGASTYSATHTNTNSSTIKGILDTWYKNNLLSNYASYIDTNAGFCGDRTSTTSSSSAPTSGSNTGGYGSTTTYYGAYYRNYKTSTPSFKCSQTNDLYTVSSSSYGNKKLTYPIGLITADEVSYAGAYKTTANSSYWLYTEQYYWTMSPYYYNSSFTYPAYVFYVNSTGSLNFSSVYGTYKVRPVLNLKASNIFTGSGTSNDPYIVT